MSKQYQNAIPLAIMIGAASALMVTAAASVICTQLINTTVITGNSMLLICPILWFAASMLGSFVTSIMLYRKYIIACAVTAVIYFGVLFTITILFFDGSYSQAGWGILSILLGVVPSILFNMKKTTSKKGKIKYRKP